MPPVKRHDRKISQVFDGSFGHQVFIVVTENGHDFHIQLTGGLDYLNDGCSRARLGDNDLIDKVLPGDPAPLL